MFPGSIATFFLVSAVLTWSCSAQSVVDPSNTGSDQRTEEVSYKIGATPSKAEVDGTRAKVRQFIWNHWQEKCDGRLTLEHYTKEGEKIVSSFEMTRSKGEKCVVRGEITGFYTARPGHPSGDRTFERIRHFTADRLQRIEIPEIGPSDVVVIAEDAIRKHDTYRIRFQNGQGETVHEL